MALGAPTPSFRSKSDSEQYGKASSLAGHCALAGLGRLSLAPRSESRASRHCHGARSISCSKKSVRWEVERRAAADAGLFNSSSGELRHLRAGGEQG